MNAVTQYTTRPAMAQAHDRPVRYAETRLSALVADAGHDDTAYDALVALMDECYPNATWSN